MGKIDHYEFWAMKKNGEEFCAVCETLEEAKSAWGKWCEENFDEGWFGITIYGPNDPDPEFAKKLSRDQYRQQADKKAKKLAKKNLGQARN